MNREHRSHRRRFGIAFSASCSLAALLLTMADAAPQNSARSDPRSALRKDPDYPQLYHDGVAFFALPPERQDAMRKLHADLAKLPTGERESLKKVLKDYADWLDTLSEADRQAVDDAADNKERLGVIKDLREKQWIARLPKATRLYLATLTSSKPRADIAAAATVGALLGPSRSPRPLTALSLWVADTTDLRSKTIARLKQEEQRQARDWVVARNFWSELTENNPKARQMMPARPVDFGADIEKYIREYLRPALSKEELARLDKAEGRWPLYPMTLVEIADKHPLALPQRNGPTAFKDLPPLVQTEVEKRFGKFPSQEPKKKKFVDTKGPDKFFGEKAKGNEIDSRLAAIPLAKPTAAMKFAVVVSDYLRGGSGIMLPHELWAASPSEMSDSMRAFLHEIGYFWSGLSSDERSQLKAAQGKWPEYPLKVQSLAGKYGLKVPWKTLPEIPGKGDFWDRYRAKPHNKLDAPFSKEKGFKRDELLKDGLPFDQPRIEPMPDVPKGKG